MKIFTNFKPEGRLSGGAQSFLKSLFRELKKKGVHVTHNPRHPVDLVFLNALTQNLDLEQVKSLSQTKRPIIHRKVGYRVSGSPQMRSIQNGVVYGDFLQLEFSKFLSHTVFQSRYSREVFEKSGFKGNSSVIYNGVQTQTFNPYIGRNFFGFSKSQILKSQWTPGEQLRVCSSSWSTDLNKGFAEYQKIDQQLLNLDIKFDFVGRIPENTKFNQICHLGALSQRNLAKVLKKAHVFISLSQYETCSNAILEAINCGLPVIYHPTGASPEIASSYGVSWGGSLIQSLDQIKSNYSSLFKNTLHNPYNIESIASQYFALFVKVLENRN